MEDLKETGSSLMDSDVKLGSGSHKRKASGELPEDEQIANKSHKTEPAAPADVDMEQGGQQQSVVEYVSLPQPPLARTNQRDWVLKVLRERLSSSVIELGVPDIVMGADLISWQREEHMEQAIGTMLTNISGANMAELKQALSSSEARVTAVWNYEDKGLKFLVYRTSGASSNAGGASSGDPLDYWLPPAALAVERRSRPVKPVTPRGSGDWSTNNATGAAGEEKSSSKTSQEEHDESSLEAEPRAFAGRSDPKASDTAAVALLAKIQMANSLCKIESLADAEPKHLLQVVAWIRKQDRDDFADVGPNEQDKDVLMRVLLYYYRRRSFDDVPFADEPPKKSVKLPLALPRLEDNAADLAAVADDSKSDKSSAAPAPAVAKKEGARLAGGVKKFSETSTDEEIRQMRWTADSVKPLKYRDCRRVLRLFGLSEGSKATVAVLRDKVLRECHL